MLDTSDVTDRKQLSDKISAHRRQLDQRRLDEERRLLYVGITRAEDTLLLSGHHWGATGIKPRGPVGFPVRAQRHHRPVRRGRRALRRGRAVGVRPADGERNPLRDSVIEAIWPADPLGVAALTSQRGAALVAAAMQRPMPAEPSADAEGWAADVDALLGRAGPRRATACAPATQRVVGQQSGGPRPRPRPARQRLMRRLPTRPEPHALLGNAFHDWVQRFYGAERLFDLADLPGAADADVARDAEELAALQAGLRSLRRGPPAHRSPSRCRSRWPIGRHRGAWPHRRGVRRARRRRDRRGLEDRRAAARRGGHRQAAVQLGVYRLAWAGFSGCRESLVRTAFHYVRTGATVVPDALPEPAELAGLRRVRRRPRVSASGRVPPSYWVTRGRGYI